MKIMLTGADGQFGRCLTECADQGQWPDGWALRGYNRHQLDITDADAVNRLVRHFKPDIVINAAAWTDVDGAQTHEDQAMAVNALGAANVAAASADCGARLIHVSTDYVFDGRVHRPADEADEPAALNTYGVSKLAGELAVQREALDAIIVRTSWVYSAYGANFVKSILRRAAQDGVLDVVDDQIGSPTWGPDLANAVIQLASRDVPPGIYHYAGRDAMTRIDFTRQIIECAARHDPVWENVQVRPVSSRFFLAAAPRPAYSVLSCQKVQALGISLYGPGDRLGQVVPALLASARSCF